MPTAAVAAHASSVDAAADGMETGRGAAAQVQMGTEAYGQICAFLPGLIDPVADRVVTALGESAAALRETALHLRAAAAAAESADDSGARRVSGAGTPLELPL
jgi:hypothetical protein